VRAKKEKEKKTLNIYIIKLKYNSHFQSTSFF